MRNHFVLAILLAAGSVGCSAIQTPLTEPDPTPAIALTEQPPIVSTQFRLSPGQDVVGEIQVIRANYEDTFVDIASAYGLGFDELVAANPDIDPWLPGEGTRVVLPTRFVLPVAARDGLVLNIAAKRLYYFRPLEGEDAVLVETFPIGIGRAGWETPTGRTTVTSKARDPVWFVPASVRKEHAAAGDPLPRQVPPGPDNPLGRFVLGLGLPGYLIHGTNKPAGVGMRVSHGCVRLFPADIEYLYELVAIGADVRIVNQPFLIGWQDNDLVFEAHPPLVEDQRDWYGNALVHSKAAMAEAPTDDLKLDEARVASIAEHLRGFPISLLTNGKDTQSAILHARWVSNIVVHDEPVDRVAVNADD
jgi:L,D-transpeptidase ErfK/SrfK